MEKRTPVAAIVVAALLLVAGAIARARATYLLASTLQVMSVLKSPTVQALTEGLADARPVEAVAEVVVGLGLALVAFVPARATSRSGVAAAVALAAGGIASAVFGAAPIPGVLALDRANGWVSYPECVAGEDGARHVFVLEGARGQFHAGVDERTLDRRLGPPELEDVLRGNPSSPVTLYVVDACKGEARDAFVSAVQRAAGKPPRVERLPPVDEVRTAWHAEAYAARGPELTRALLAVVARLVALVALVALALGARRAPLALKVALGALVVAALLSALSPWMLWSDVAPGPTHAPDYRDVWSGFGPFAAASLASSAFLGIGALAFAIGAAMATSAPSSER